jgi:hypothetical protein
VSTSISPADLDRKIIDLGDDEEGRVYFADELPKDLPSVTTVTNERVDPDKKEAIEGWEDWYDGSTERRSPHHERQLDFKGWRGTLAHYAVLSQLGDISAGADDYFAQLGDSDRGFEEYYAEYKLKTMGEYDGADPWQKAIRDSNYVCKEFDEIAKKRGITGESVIDVERYVIDQQWGYAGQFDLLYENDDGETVLADLKTSSAIRIDYKIQLAAYAHAIAEDVDRLEVIRIYPDDREVEVEDDTDWNRSYSDLFEQFLGCCYRTHEKYINSF